MILEASPSHMHIRDVVDAPCSPYMSISPGTHSHALAVGQKSGRTPCKAQHFSAAEPLRECRREDQTPVRFISNLEVPRRRRASSARAPSDDMPPAAGEEREDGTSRTTSVLHIPLNPMPSPRRESLASVSSAPGQGAPPHPRRLRFGPPVTCRKPVSVVTLFKENPTSRACQSP